MAARTLLETLNSQLLEIDKTIGSQALATDVQESLKKTFEAFTGDRSTENVLSELLDLYNTLLDCQPRMPNVILPIQKLIVSIHDDPKIELKDLQEALSAIEEDREERFQRIIENTAKLIGDDNKTILLHSYSRKITRILSALKGKGAEFKVIVAMQEPEKSDKLVQVLHDAGITFTAVSEYSIAHVIPEVDLALFGALTLNTNGRIVMGPGSSSIISNLENSRVPNYILMTASKFNLWEQDTPPAYVEVRKKRAGAIRYDKKVFSHDILPVEFITGFITEEGVLDPTQVLNYVRSLQKDFMKREEIIEELWVKRGKS